jgi:hypothetical protein
MPPKWNFDHAESLVAVTVEDNVTLICSTIATAVAWLMKQKA